MNTEHIHTPNSLENEVVFTLVGTWGMFLYWEKTAVCIYVDVAFPEKKEEICVGMSW